MIETWFLMRFFFIMLCRYIEENYTKIRDVEREFGNLTMEMKLTAGPKKAGLASWFFFWVLLYGTA